MTKLVHTYMERQIDTCSINQRASQIFRELSNSIGERSLCVQLENALIHLQRSVIQFNLRDL